MVTEIKEKAQGFSLEELTALLISLIDKKEENVQSELKALSKKDSKSQRAHKTADLQQTAAPPSPQ